MSGSTHLPLPPLQDTSNPYEAFADYLQRITHVSLYGHDTSIVLGLIALLSCNVVLSLVYCFGHWARLRKERKGLWFCRLVNRQQGHYVTLNQAVASSLTNFTVSVIWLMYAIYLYYMWRPHSTLPGHNYLYFSNTANCLSFLPLYLMTWLSISAGNLTASSNGRHFLPAWVVNSLLALGLVLFVTLFVPALISAHSYTKWVKVARAMMMDSLVSAKTFDTAASTPESREAIVQQLIGNTYTVLNPLRQRAYWYQIRYRYVEITVFAVLIIINLSGFFFLIRHLRQDHSGALVYSGQNVVAPLATHLSPSGESKTGGVGSFASSSSPGNSPVVLGGGGGELAPVGQGGFGRALTRTGTMGGKELEERETYEGGEQKREEQMRPPWDVTLNYFCVVPVCVLVIGFVGFVIANYGSVKINSALVIEIAASSVIWAYTLSSLLSTSALIFKKLLFTPSPSSHHHHHHPNNPRFAENPFNTRTGRRGVVPEGEYADAKDARTEEEREKASHGALGRSRTREEKRGLSVGAAGGRRPSLGVAGPGGGGGGRKASIVSLASSIGSRISSSFGGSYAESSLPPVGGGGARRGSYAPEKEREEEVRGPGGGQSLMAGVHHVIDFETKPGVATATEEEDGERRAWRGTEEK